MSARNPHLVAEENVGSMLPAWGESQRHKTETFTTARQLRAWIHANPGKTRREMPDDIGGYVGFLMQKKLVTWRNGPTKSAITGKPERIYFSIPQ